MEAIDFPTKYWVFLPFVVLAGNSWDNTNRNIHLDDL